MTGIKRSLIAHCVMSFHKRSLYTKWNGVYFLQILSVEGRSCSDIWQTASWVGKYLNSFVIDLGEVKIWHALKESTLTGNESSVIVHCVMFSIKEILQKRNASYFLTSSHSDSVFYSESKYSVELLSCKYLCNCLSYVH